MNITDISESLPWHESRRWGERSLSQINKIIIHQTLGESELEDVNHYHIGPNHISERGCPRICYHFGIRKNGEVVKLNDLKHIVWHAKGQNTSGIGILVAGNFAGPGHNTGTRLPTEAQMKSLAELCDYLLAAFDFSYQEIYGHYHFGKPACPGTHIQNWIESKREQIVNPDIDFSTITKSVEEIQARLNKLNYNAGPVDGIQGIMTLKAIRQFQSDHGLVIDGIVGPKTWHKLVALSS
jgi:N-acetyl-anhydromuramyl-L-alanine amidase AmpD